LAIALLKMGPRPPEATPPRRGRKSMPTAAQWTATWETLGAPPPAGVYEELLARHAEPERHYHTARHLDECFAALTAVRQDAEHPVEVELALWFHDAIYDPQRHDNEERSAAWARSVLAQAGVAASVVERVAALIMATRHDATPVGADASVLVDVDLSILGAPSARFDEYERDVRREYAWVPEIVFRRRRREILERLLARPQLFSTPRMRELHEHAARANLARSLRRLAPSRRDRLRIAAGLAAVTIGLAGSVLAAPTWIALTLAGGVWLLYELAAPSRW
jgi:predicted metal-dependent HD superfamily phosphohydrolase